ncbi:Conserved Hypothetical Protein [Streptomyces leeuwenhoekii]|nr:Conserved Hypothetical Protein [Streptomyces leeuwenhoekii]
MAFGWRGPVAGVTLTGMTIQTTRLRDPAVRAFVAAVNAHDREAFLALLAPGATMADDGLDRDLDDWIDQEIFSSNGHLQVDRESNGGRALLAHYRNDTWGEMRTRWSFTVDEDGRISRFETGQV